MLMNADKPIVIGSATMAMLIGFVIPLLTGLLTRLNLKSKIKGAITIGLNLINGFLTSLLLTDGSGLFTWQVFFNFLIGFGISIAAYLGLFKPAGLTSSTYAPDPAHPEFKEVGALATKGIK